MYTCIFFNLFRYFVISVRARAAYTLAADMLKEPRNELPFETYRIQLRNREEYDIDKALQVLKEQAELH